MSFPETVLLAIFHTASAIFSVCGNLLTLTAIRQTRRLQSISNYFIASLAAADFLVGLIVNPLFVARSILNIWDEHHALVVATEWMSMQTLIASTFNLAAVSLDRYIAVTSVFLYEEKVTTGRCIGVIAFTWIFSLAFSLLRWVVMDPLNLPKLWIAVAVVGYTIPFGVMAFSYYHIYKAARVQSHKIAVASNTISNEMRQFKKDKKAAWTVGIVIGLFVVLACPSLTIAGVQLLTTNNCLKIQMVRFWCWGALFSFASSACNPWVYAFRSREYKEAFESIFQSMRIMKRNPQIQPTTGTMGSTSVAAAVVEETRGISPSH